jgi:polysaccharide export outer membrane protein
MSIDRARVREDGRISMPFLQDVDVAGQTPNELANRLQVKLKSLVVSPVVTVTLVERRPTRVSVVGEVAHPGQFDLDRGAGVLQALAAAGGLTAYAHRDRIFVLRYGYWADGNPEPARIRFEWSNLIRGRRPSSTFRLEPGDVVTVE